MLRIQTRCEKHVSVARGTSRVSAHMSARSVVLSDEIAATANCNNTNDHVEGTPRWVLTSSGRERGAHARR